MLAVAWAMPIGSNAGPKEAEHVRWDIASFDFTTTPFTISAGGVASAIAPSNLRITLTGSGTFVAPASGGTSGAVTGGGTWETFGPTGASTGSGTYQVTKLVDWEFANIQLPNLIDLIGNEKLLQAVAVHPGSVVIQNLLDQQGPKFLQIEGGFQARILLPALPSAFDRAGQPASGTRD